MAGMVRFSLKSVFIGLTSTAIGMAMLALAFHETADTGVAVPQEVQEVRLVDAFLVAFGGAFVGFGLSFPVIFPPYRYWLAIMGMFAAQGWSSGSFMGLFLYAGLMAAFVVANEIQRRRAGAAK
jgi:hypothetical protein